MKFITDDKYKSNLDIASNYQIKKFAGKLKDIACLLIGCTREQLEDREFKEKELGKEWWYYTDTLFNNSDSECNLYAYNEYHDKLKDDLNYYIIKLTPRKLLQILGTEAGRQVIHPNIWVNALFADYIGNNVFTVTEDDGMSGTQELVYPNWIITDVRFPNEAQAIKDRGGIVIRINRDYQNPLMPDVAIPEHPSETALDNHNFDYVIDNSGSISDLIDKVKQLKL